MTQPYTHVTGARIYLKTGELLHDNTVRHFEKGEAVRDANYIATRPPFYDNEDLIPITPANVYVRDLSTGRFVKWRGVCL